MEKEFRIDIYGKDKMFNILYFDTEKESVKFATKLLKYNMIIAYQLKHLVNGEYKAIKPTQ